MNPNFDRKCGYLQFYMSEMVKTIFQKMWEMFSRYQPFTLKDMAPIIEEIYIILKFLDTIRCNFCSQINQQRNVDYRINHYEILNLYQLYLLEQL